MQITHNSQFLKQNITHSKHSISYFLNDCDNDDTYFGH